MIIPALLIIAGILLIAGAIVVYACLCLSSDLDDQDEEYRRKEG